VCVCAGAAGLLGCAGTAPRPSPEGHSPTHQLCPSAYSDVEPHSGRLSLLSPRFRAARHESPRWCTAPAQPACCPAALLPWPAAALVRLLLACCPPAALPAPCASPIPPLAHAHSMTCRQTRLGQPLLSFHPPALAPTVPPAPCEPYQVCPDDSPRPAERCSWATRPSPADKT
jgi:hypothetical protein